MQRSGRAKGPFMGDPNSAASGAVGPLGTYKTTTLADQVGYFNFNNTDYTLATSITVSDTNGEGDSQIVALLNSLSSGDFIIIHDTDNDIAIAYTYTSHTAFAGGFSTITVTHIGGSGTLVEDASMSPRFDRKGVTDFLGLTDTPVNYTGSAGKTTKVNAGETGLEFVKEASPVFVSDMNQFRDAVLAQEQFIVIDTVFTVTGITLEFKQNTLIIGERVTFRNDNPVNQVFMRIRDAKKVQFFNAVTFDGSGTSSQLDVTTVGGRINFSKIRVSTIALLIDDGTSFLTVLYEDETLDGGGSVTTVGASATYTRNNWHTSKTKLTAGAGVVLTESADSILIDATSPPGSVSISRIVNLANADTTIKQTEFASNFICKAFAPSNMTVTKMLFHLNDQWSTGISPATATTDFLGVALYSKDGATLHAKRDVLSADAHFTAGNLIDEGEGIWSLAFVAPFNVLGGNFYNLTIKMYQTSGSFLTLSGKTLIANTTQPLWSIGHEWFGSGAPFPASVTLTSTALQTAWLAVTP